MVDQQKMRASDRDRQQVVERLRSALEDGRLTMEEYVNRMEVAYQAATYGDLTPLCADLPASNPVTGGPPKSAAALAPATVVSRAGYLAGPTQRIMTPLPALWPSSAKAAKTSGGAAPSDAPRTSAPIARTALARARASSGVLRTCPPKSATV